ncbi:uncharacterized protein LOC133201984 [Saccostrea echinata]|uniref:uncharacterized protein LOC133201984 n=1 Tax=Saccostrea echinata TaxID=191078 RepID=UPI002A7EAA89|nr:uncharacterized protein LOC133201984 [Saccostrea echinata]
MKKELFVPSIHAESLNPKIPFKECKLKVCQSVEKWSQNEKGDRIASINCFGFGGTNSHAIITDYHRTGTMSNQKMHTCLSYRKYVILSAEDLIALNNLAKQLVASLQNEFTLEDISSTTVHFRNHYKFRKVFVVEQLSELVTKLDNFVKEDVIVKSIGKDRPKIIFVYCGVGTTWRKMCKEFITQDYIFKRTIQDIDDSLRSLTSVSVESLFENEEDISDPLENHLAIFACQIALTEVWKHLGICPDTIVGQSVGEVAAAYASGTLSLKDAVRVIYFRSLHLANENAGKMVVIQNCPIAVIEEKCLNLKCGKANIAVYHSYHSCAVSGDKIAIEELQSQLVSHNAKMFPLNVKCAYHSHLTKEASLKLEETLRGLEWKIPSTTVISTVSGMLVDKTFGSPSYWAANVFKPVLFRHAIQEAKSINTNALFLEIGPSPVLKAHLASIFLKSEEVSLPSMKRNNEIEILRKSFIDIFEKGIRVAWENVVPCTSNMLAIGKYQFNKRKNLLKSERLKCLLNGEEDNQNNMLLSRIPGSSEQFKIMLSHENTPFVYEHIVDGSTVVPGALYGEIGLEIGHFLVPESGFTELEISWSINRAVLVKDSEESLVVIAKRKNNQVIYFETYPSGNMSPVSSGKISIARTLKEQIIDVQRLIALLKTETESRIIYMIMQRLGFQHGPIYQTIKKCVTRDEEIICEICLSNELMKEITRTCLHPVILDSMFHSCFGINVDNGKSQKVRILPLKVHHLVVRQRPSQSMICYATLVNDNATNAKFNILLLQNNGSIVAEMRNFEVEKINSPEAIHSLSYHETWKPVSLQEKPVQGKVIFVLSWNSEYLSLIENTFRKECTDVEICSLNLTKTPDNEFSTLQKKAEMQKIFVIFVPGLPGIDENTTGKWLYDNVRKTSQVFLGLLKSIYKMKSHILVITNEAQPCKSPKPCVIGAELWGMVRAVSHEGTELSFTLLDVDSLSEFSLMNISRVIIGQDAGNVQVPSEYAIRGNVIYTNEITKLPENFHASLYKQSFREASQPVRIRKTFESDKLNFFAIPCSVECNNMQTICVQPTHALTCSEDTLFIYNNNSPELYCSDANIKGEEIQICELLGFAKLGNKNVEVIACCQMELQTEMMIYNDCVFVKSSFEGYKLGDMHAVIIALSLADLMMVT